MASTDPRQDDEHLVQPHSESTPDPNPESSNPKPTTPANPKPTTRANTNTDTDTDKPSERIPNYIKLKEQQLPSSDSKWSNDLDNWGGLKLFTGDKNSGRFGDMFGMPNLIPVLIRKEGWPHYGGVSYVLNDYGTTDFFLWNDRSLMQLQVFRKSRDLASGRSGNLLADFEEQLQHVLNVVYACGLNDDEELEPWERVRNEEQDPSLWY